MEQVYIPKQNYKVLVRCFTYNQSKYIEDALNGFAMQKTDFPFVCLVMDDASTDGEQEVIKAWMERECDMERAENVEIEKSFITLVPHKTNSSCMFAFYFLKENLYGADDKKMCLVNPWREHCEYEALCEGDDYWIEPQKLQIETDYLKLTGLQVVYTDYNIKYQDIDVYEKGCLTFDISKIPSEQVVEKWILEKSYAAPMTWLVSTKIVTEVSKIDIQSVDGTFVYFTYYLYKNVVGVIPNKITAVYRINKGSASHPSNFQMSYLRDKGLLETQLILIDRFLKEERREKARKKARGLYYDTCFFQILAMADQNELYSLKEFSSKNLLHNLLMFVTKCEAIRKFYKDLYVRYKRVR